MEISLEMHGDSFRAFQVHVYIFSSVSKLSSTVLTFLGHMFALAYFSVTSISRSPFPVEAFRRACGRPHCPWVLLQVLVNLELGSGQHRTIKRLSTFDQPKISLKGEYNRETSFFRGTVETMESDALKHLFTYDTLDMICQRIVNEYFDAYSGYGGY